MIESYHTSQAVCCGFERTHAGTLSSVEVGETVDAARQASGAQHTVFDRDGCK